jgi:glutamate transport system permease protein
MNAVFGNLDLYARGILTTIEICVLAGVLALVLGTLMATFRISPVPTLRFAGTSWVNLLRNCPLTIVVSLFVFGLPEAGVNGSFFGLGVSALAVYTSAFVCEAVRAGVNSVAPGQAEASRALGLGFGQSLRYIVMPQAFRSVIPPLGSTYIAMIKNSAIVGAFGVGGELFGVQATLTGSRGYAALPVLTGVVIGYLLLTLPAGAFLARIERKVAISR